MEMQFKNEINKLADIVVWADNWIGKLKSCLTEEEFAEDEEVKVFEAVRKSVLDAMTRHAVYTNALNKDLADKAAKIELLEKEIEGRKEGYVALKELMDTKYISIEEHNNICKTYEKKVAELKKESEKWQDLAKMNRDTICDQYNVCEEFKNKITEIEEEVEKWKKKFDDSRKETINRNAKIVILEEENEKLKVDLIHEREKNEKLAKDHAELENDMRKYTTDIISQSGTICNLKKELDRVKASKENWFDTANAYARTVSELNNEKEKLDETIKNCIPLTAYEIAVNDLKEEIKKLKEENKDLKVRDEELTKQVANKLSDIDSLRKYITHWKNQERIRTDQLRATESKVEELWEEMERLRDLGEHWKRSYFNTRYSLNKLKDEPKEDDHGRKGFKRYIEWLVKEEEAKYKESWKARLNEELEAIFKEEEETKVDDIPCGEDAIE